ncbi:ABC transporter ATP-binding protein [Microbacterium lacus]|uniref:ABC transporter ATP-binding protein n=1 Tax=Microbacterium lacus TaxID=415217 RepID=UPI00385070C9
MIVEEVHSDAVTPRAAVLEVRELTIDVPRAGDSPLRLVDGVDLILEAGTVTALVGESGSGKTVTARSIIGLDPELQVGGSIRVGGQQVVGLAPRLLQSLRGARVGMVFQDSLRALDPLMSIGAQVAEPLRLRGVGRSESRKRAVVLLESLGLRPKDGLLDQYPHQLSGGMRQRVCIAMALIAEPDVLIADEPTTALDVRVQRTVLTLLRDIAVSRGLAVLLITHDLGVVAEVADRVVVMYGGRPVEAGSAIEVFRNPAHPYTRGLLAALPRLDRPDLQLRPIPGAAVLPTDRPLGCAFVDRCAVALDHCADVLPDSRRVGDTHTAACHLIEEHAR